MAFLLCLILGCPVTTDVPVGDGVYAYEYTDNDGPDLQAGLLLTLEDDAASFGYLDPDGQAARVSVGLVRRAPDAWETYTPPKNIDGYRCEHAALDPVAFELPGVLDGPGGDPAVVSVVAPETGVAPELFAECTRGGDMLFLGVLVGPDGDRAAGGNAVFFRVDSAVADTAAP